MRKNSLKILLFLGIISACSPVKNRDDHSHETEKSTSKDREYYRRQHPELVKAQLHDREKIEEDNPKGYNHIHPLNEVEWTTSDQIKNLKFEDEVTVFKIKDTHYVLPWYVMKNHHVGNLTLQGTDVVVTLCEACSGSAAFSPWVDDKKLSFALGGIYNGTNCMVDESGDVWGTFTGKALTGPMKGTELERVQMYQDTWKEWLRTGFGETTLVADYPDIHRKGHGGDYHIGDERIGFRKTMEKPVDRRMPHAEMVQGVYVNGGERAYTHKLIRENTIVMDTLGGVNIVLFSIPKSTIISCFNRLLDDQLLTFVLDGELIMDLETESHWQIDGLAIDGPLKGEQLEYVSNYHEEWYAWSAYRPKTTIYQQ